MIRSSASDVLPQGQRRDIYLVGGLFVLALLVQVIGFKRNCGPYDEFLSLYGADRVLHGEIPYRDFWTMYGPAQFYVLAGFFKIFGIEHNIFIF